MTNRMTGIWEIASDGPPLTPERSTEMLATLRRITEAMQPGADVVEATVTLGLYRWRFRRLAPLTLLEGPDGAIAVLSEEPAVR